MVAQAGGILGPHQDPGVEVLPELAEAACEREAVFRASPQGVDDAVAALKKIQEHAGELAEAADFQKTAFKAGII